MEARRLLAGQKRAKIGDQLIGRILSFVPVRENEPWPASAVRDVIETVRSVDLELGIEIGRRNSRGVTSRGLTYGGSQERGLQAQYLAFAQRVGPRYHRTAAMLRRIARAYADEAQREDENAQITEDRF
jgi:hypothetical protein